MGALCEQFSRGDVATGRLGGRAGRRAGGRLGRPGARADLPGLGDAGDLAFGAKIDSH